jgi:hypothetical protein
MVLNKVAIRYLVPQQWLYGVRILVAKSIRQIGGIRKEAQAATREAEAATREADGHRLFLRVKLQQIASWRHGWTVMGVLALTSAGERHGRLRMDGLLPPHGAPLAVRARLGPMRPDPCPLRGQDRRRGEPSISNLK